MQFKEEPLGSEEPSRLRLRYLKFAPALLTGPGPRRFGTGAAGLGGTAGRGEAT